MKEVYKQCDFVGHVGGRIHGGSDPQKENVLDSLIFLSVIRDFNLRVCFGDAEVIFDPIEIEIEIIDPIVKQFSLKKLSTHSSSCRK
jgi:hypothetical protein